jgi:hypothetical protein
MNLDPAHTRTEAGTALRRASAPIAAPHSPPARWSAPAAPSSAPDRPSGRELPTPAEPPAVRRWALPRTCWVGLALAAVVWQAAVGRPGVALLLLAAFLPLLALPRRAGPSWLSCALAPVLGLAGLAATYPAIAGQARGWRARAGLGALGYWWLLLAEPLLATRLWLGSPPGSPPRAVWEGSLQAAATHVIGPMLGVGLLLGAALWAVAAMTLPWLVRGRNAALDAVAATMWSAAIITAAPLVDAGLSSHVTHASPRGAVLGAVLGAILAVAARALRGPT